MTRAILNLKPIFICLSSAYAAVRITHTEVNEWLKTLSILAAIGVSLYQAYKVSGKK